MVVEDVLLKFNQAGSSKSCGYEYLEMTVFPRHLLAYWRHQ